MISVTANFPVNVMHRISIALLSMHVGLVSLQAFEISDALAPAQFDQFRNQDETNASADEIFLQGLAQQYPKQVITALPHAPNHTKIAPIVLTLPRDIVYLRIYDFATDLDETLDHLTHPALILDLRYVFAAAQVDYIAHLDALQRDHPIIVLTNQQTSGPWETQLADLQAAQKITTVGKATAGNTGVYQQFWESPVYYKLIDEFLPQDQRSILQTGVIPNVPIDVRVDEDYQSYYAVNKGYAVADMIELSYDDTTSEADTAPANGKAILNDKILQRAVDIIVALQILGELPL